MCAVAASVVKDSLASIVLFSAYSLVMAVIWIIMESPDLRAFLKAYSGYGVTAVREIRQVGIGCHCVHYIRMQFRIRDAELGIRSEK